MKGSIRVSEKHGVNPSMMKCMICGKDYAIALLGRLQKDAQAPREIHSGLCDKCKKLLDNGNTCFINKNNGDVAVIKKEAVKKMIDSYKGFTKKQRKEEYDKVAGKIVYVDKTFWPAQNKGG